MAETRSNQVGFEWAEQGGGEKAPGAAPEPQAAPGGRKAARPRRKGTQAPEAPPALPADDELWDVHATARFLKRSLSWVYHRAEDGTLPVKRLAGWGLRFIPSELRAWVESGGVAPARHRE
jgi:predicted DNA-binding transcriptional regulator AlpA